MRKLFELISFTLLFFILIFGNNFVTSASNPYFFEDFTEENLSQDWNFVHVAAGGEISSNKGILNIRASSLFQDSPNSAMVMRHWLSQNDNFLNISVRLKINSFDRFAIQVDHKKPIFYSDLSPMFGLVFRAAGTPTSNYILAVGKQNGEWKGGLGVEGSLISNLKVNEWYQSEIFIQESSYTVVFTLMDDQRNVLIQKTIDAKSLTNYNFEEIGSVGFSAWTSLRDGPYGNTDIDWISISFANDIPANSTFPVTTSPSSTGVSVISSDNSSIILVIFVIVGLLILLLSILLWLRKKRTREIKQRIVNIIAKDHKVNFEDMAKVFGVSDSKIKKLFSELANKDLIERGYYIKNEKEFVTESLLANYILKIGKISLVDLSSKISVTEDYLKKMIQNLIERKKLQGSFTKDGRVFLTQDRIIDELGED